MTGAARPSDAQLVQLAHDLMGAIAHYGASAEQTHAAQLASDLHQYLQQPPEVVEAPPSDGAIYAEVSRRHAPPELLAAVKASLVDVRAALCPTCMGNDQDMPCAYPGEGLRGCLRDQRLASTNQHSIDNLTFHTLLNKIMYAVHHDEVVVDAITRLTDYIESVLTLQRLHARHEGREEAAASYSKLLHNAGKELVEWEKLKDPTTLHINLLRGFPAVLTPRMLHHILGDYSDASMAATVLNKEQIKAIFLEHGFTIKDGLTDLKPYVYEAAHALLLAYQQAITQQD